MKRRQGFTLVELLVVMAIISILAAIVVPNVQRHIVRARVTRAISEINGVELAMTAMLTDAGRGNLAQLFIAGAVPRSLGWAGPADTWPAWITQVDGNNVTNFQKVTQIYTNVVYSLLTLGRNVLTDDPGVANFVPKEVITKLGTNYMDLGADPWGNDYQIFPGPWRVASEPGNASNRYPIIFRKFTVEKSDNGSARGARNDGYLVYTVDDSTTPGVEGDDFMASFGDIVLDVETWPNIIGYPADTNKPVYIWSTGANLRSGQMIYRAAYNPQEDKRTWYEVQDEGDIGGGDDINNWDPGASWQRFYN